MSVGTTQRAAGDIELDLAALDELANRLANLIVDRVVEAIAARTGRIDAPANLPIDRAGLWTVRQVAVHYGVTPSFVYQHADELGCIRLGGGTCARLRFDPRVLRERWAIVGKPPTMSTRRRTGSAPRRPSRAHAPSYDLLDFDREP